MEVVGSKVLVMFLLGIFCMLLGFIPLKLGNWFRNRDGSPRHGTILSSLLCFGGGILLATSLIHMLPEVSHNLISPWGIQSLSNDLNKTMHSSFSFVFLASWKLWGSWHSSWRQRNPSCWNLFSSWIFLNLLHRRICAFYMWFKITSSSTRRAAMWGTKMWRTMRRTKRANSCRS